MNKLKRGLLLSVSFLLRSIPDCLVLASECEEVIKIVECRRVLKWTYAYGYYLPEAEKAKRQFFEYLQGEADAGLERLHKCAKKELNGFLNSDGPSKDFNDFRTKLAGLTSVTRNYFENLVRALENGLSDVDAQGEGCSKSSSLGQMCGWRTMVSFYSGKLNQLCMYISGRVDELWNTPSMTSMS